MDSTNSSTDATVILDDKCLVEVFKHLSLRDWCAVAEVCSRFEHVAKTCFQLSTKTDLILMDDVKCDGDSDDQVIFKMSKILHHFGAYFTKFDGDDWRNTDSIHHWLQKSQAEFQHRVFDLLIQHCSGTLVELKICGIQINDEMVSLMKPLLQGLHILEMRFISICQAFLDMLPLLSPKVKELKLILKAPLNGMLKEEVFRFDSLHQPFRKMVEIVLWHAHDLNNQDFEEMLKHNPQLKRITLYECPKLDGQIFESIANHVTDVESLKIGLIPFERRHVQHFGQFRNLNSLKYFHNLKSKYMVSLMHQMGEANIPLKMLDLSFIYFGSKRSDASEFVDEVKKLKSLDTLKLKNLDGLNTSHFYIMCKSLPQLRQISLQPRFPLNPVLISDIIRNADQLEWIHLTSHKNSCDKPLTIVSENFKEWVRIVTERCSDTPLEMWLGDDSYTTKHTIPVKASEGSFTLLICGGFRGRVNIIYEALKEKLHSTCGVVNSF